MTGGFEAFWVAHLRALRTAGFTVIRMYGVFPARKHLPLRLRAFVDYLKRAFAAAPLDRVLAASPPPSHRRPA
jgi:hypothetical protein